MKILKLVFTLAALSTVSGETLECEYRKSFYSNYDQMIYSCVVANREIFGANPTFIDSVTGRHNEGESDDDVDGFTLSYAPQMKNFPLGLEHVFRNLVYISIAGTSIQELHGDDFRPFPQLKYLRLMSNEIKSIPADLFRYTPNLEVLEMSSNRIERVAPRAFSRLRKLHILDLSWNRCSGMDSSNTKEEVRAMIRTIIQGECGRGYVQRPGQLQGQRQGQLQGQTTTLSPDQVGTDFGGFAMLDNLMESLANMRREMDEKLRKEKEELQKLQNQMKHLERFNGEMTTTPSTDDEQMPDLTSLGDFFAFFQSLGQAFGDMAEEEQQEQEGEEEKE